MLVWGYLGHLINLLSHPGDNIEAQANESTNRAASCGHVVHELYKWMIQMEQNQCLE